MNRLLKAVEQNGGQTLLGAALYFYDPIFLEVAAHLGYQAIWIEMEHAPITFAEAADLCRMAAGSGMLTMIRIPDSRRENILKAAECGPDIIDVAMVDRPAQMDEMLEYGRFAPAGGRGYFSVSRAVQYGVLNSVNETQQSLNRELCLMAQIETTEAMKNLDELAAVSGVDLFVGPPTSRPAWAIRARPCTLLSAMPPRVSSRRQGPTASASPPPADQATSSSGSISGLIFSSAPTISPALNEAPVSHSTRQEHFYLRRARTQSCAMRVKRNKSTTPSAIPGH